MAKCLIIVESPAKAKTISKFLGRSYVVKASMGHVRDLPRSQFGVDVDNGFTPKYITIRGKGPVLNELKKAQKKVERVYLAADPDREGEAICWHLAEYLGLGCDDCRIEFNEITKNAVRSALKNPRKIDMNRVEAQQARRILDRIVGYRLSPLLWSKVKKGLSAGRVQTVAMRLICEREREIQEFQPEEYWSITANLTPDTKTRAFEAALIQKGRRKLEIRNEQEARSIEQSLDGEQYIVQKVTRKERKRHPAPPFITSSMQQEASRKLGFSASKTMRIAQQLYEGLGIGAEGSVGLITYMRTDSARVSREAQMATREYVARAYGKEFVPASIPVYRVKEGAQDAHEAIRPTSVEREPDAIKQFLTRDQHRLYRLIWERFTASQMASAVLDTTSVDISAGRYIFRATGSVIKFPGFMAVYIEGSDDGKNHEGRLLPELTEQQVLKMLKLDTVQHFTKPPARYSEAMLVKALEENGIGRPSTYASIIDTILKRGYVLYEDKRLMPSELGMIVTELLVKHFPDIFNVDFTASMETRLDKINEAAEDWTSVLHDFYSSFSGMLTKAEHEMEEVNIQDEVSDVVCEKCGRNMVIKHGRYGKFLACPGFPDCRNTQPLIVDLGVKCPKCGGSIIERRTKKRRIFYGCSSYPQCDFVTWYKPTGSLCSKCGSFLVRVKGKRGTIDKCSNPDCKRELVASS